MDSLPDELFHQILSFCQLKDTLKVATLNHAFCRKIEAFYQQQLNEFRESHPIDETWDDRLLQRANERHENPSFRRLWNCASEIPMYSSFGHYLL